MSAFIVGRVCLGDCFGKEEMVVMIWEWDDGPILVSRHYELWNLVSSESRDKGSVTPHLFYFKQIETTQL